jgi:hypothetical protein
MKYLKYLQTANDFESFKNSEDYVLPNVSYIEETKGVSFEPEPPFYMVDLGLPSGRLWCDRNIGASSPEDYGLYFQWGETVGYTAKQVTNGEEKFASDWSNYFDTTDGGKTFNKYAKDKLTVLQPEDDAATVNMGAEYRMPTKADFEELINNTTITFVRDNENYSSLEYNLKGIKFTASNGNYIFIPAAGSLKNNYYDGSPKFSGTLWASTLYYNSSPDTFNFSCYGSKYTGEQSRYYGCPIRGVK